MSEEHSPDAIHDHITSIGGRTPAEAARLVAMLSARPWPTGGDDRSEPGAVAWLKRWRPTGPRPALVACGCATQRCEICN